MLKNVHMLMKKILLFFKKIINTLFGKIRWYLILFTVSLVIFFCTQTDNYISIRINGVNDENKIPINESEFTDVQAFTINESGTIAAISDIGYYGYTAVYDIETKEKDYAFTNDIFADPDKKDKLSPSNLVITDQEDIYAVRAYYKSIVDKSFTKESIVKLSKDYKYIDKICDIEYEGTEGLLESGISRLHYFDGYVTFGFIYKDNVKLYRIDTNNGKVEISRDYPSEENGTFTVNIIPIDGAYLFVRSDGNVYRTEFDEPLEEVVYHFDTEKSPYFTDAVLIDNDLYVFDENKPEKIYRISEGTAEEVLDLSNDEGLKNRSISFIDSYKDESNKSVLAICLSDGLLTYKDGKITERDTLLKIDDHFLIILRYIPYIFYYISIFGIIINLIIRRKTIFYKQIMVTVPIFAVIAIVIGINIYNSSAEQNKQNVKNELSIITHFGANELDGYDFSNLLVANESTGKEYRALQDKLAEISTGHTEKWSEDYMFSIIQRTDTTRAGVLADEKKTCMPLFTEEEDFTLKDIQGNDDIYFNEDINSLLTSEAMNSGISAYALIDDGGSAGDIYLKVTTTNDSFYEYRGLLWIKMIFYVCMVIIFFAATNMLMSLYIRRMIKKATGVVKKISEGDLTARVEYKSKDEMGEICNEVNSMGQNLEKLFNEKDRTEKFYYKFVPEQFRTLLGKEEFTDLQLGDSDSRELTVLFLDIRGFSLISEKMTTKENFEFVNIIYGVAGPIIRRNNGFIDKYIGDAIMALFETADDALRSGIDIYKAIVLDHGTAEKIGVDDINIGIGIHTGMAQIGIVGEEERLSGTVISDTVNLSSRFESLTKQYKTAVLVSKDTVEKLTNPESLDLRYLGFVQVAGVNEVKEIYEVLDCLPDEERERRHHNSFMLGESIKMFREGRKEEAVDMLTDLSNSGTSDYVTDKYLEYITNLAPEEKSGVFRFVRK
ncbi:Adenylate cyclase, class 3 [Lachnospiraceae bacterium NE2001]|nr:Adenylate cyclase, class 3 [Lachnospiraceae bacterium NE2001]